MQLTDQERAEVFIDKARQLEEKALRKQQMLKVGKGNTIEDIIEINDMYIDSVKAKLEVLNDIENNRR